MIELMYDENENSFLSDKSWSDDGWIDRGRVRGLLGRLKHPLEGDVRKDIVTKLMRALSTHLDDETANQLWQAYTKEFGSFYFEETPFEV